jgi:hypothetical protein
MELPLRKPAEEEIGRDWEEFTGGAPVAGLRGVYQPGGMRAPGRRRRAGGWDVRRAGAQ